MLLEERLDVRHLRIHLALHIARRGIAAIPENPLVVDETRRVDAAEVFAHLVDVAPAAGLIAARPDKDARMILVTLVHRLRTVEHGGQPHLVIPGHGIRVLYTRAVLHPRAVRLKIRLVDDIEPVNIAQLVETAAVRIVRCTDRIDVHALQGNEILRKERGIHCPPVIAVKLVTVDPLEHNALAIDLHQTVPHAELTETDTYAHDLL